MNSRCNLTTDQVLDLVAHFGSLGAAATATGIARTTLQYHQHKSNVPRRGPGAPTVTERGGKTSTLSSEAGTERRLAPVTERVHPQAVAKRPVGGKVRRYLLTCAQNNTKVHPEFFTNLLAFKEHLGAELHVSRFTYKRNAMSPYLTKDMTEEEKEAVKAVWWDPKVVPFLSDKRTELAPGLLWCADMDTLPTAVRPLSGLESHTGRASGVFPHPKIAMEPIASGKHEGTKHNYTTGTVTLRNYIPRKAGKKAEFHHCYAALLVEVDAEGTWFARQINADSDGTFYDLHKKVENGEVFVGQRAEAIYWGDGHSGNCDMDMVKLAFGVGGIKDVLRPKKDFIGDVISFKSRSHHEIKDPHLMFMRHAQGYGCVKQEVTDSIKWFFEMYRADCKTYSVYGNHERHIGIWLKNQDARFDPKNAVFWSKMQAATFSYIQEHREQPNFMELACEVVNVRPPVKFLQEDESVIVCPDHGGGIECGMHGDRGPNGSRGSAVGFAKSGRKTCVGHAHSTMIRDGVYVAGTFEMTRDNDWTRGQSSWSASHVIIYPNGKRAIVTCYDKKWRA